MLSKKLQICLNFSCFFDGIGISFKNICCKKSIGIGFEKFWYRKSIGFKKFGIEKVSDSENTFEETRNHLKNIYIKGWRCLFLPIRKSSQKYQGVAVLVGKKGRQFRS